MRVSYLARVAGDNQGAVSMLDIEGEIAFAIWSTQTGNASRSWWEERTTEGERDQYVRAARMVIRRLFELGFKELDPRN